ncbi:AAA family ATPase [uncultured Lamprocystis sp.]|jgi:predicted ATPase|uniref:AAA family ATPase n=1 Tax=uncultured Lamprocystis sp. TaxID=543132 RepID=UPI0025FC915C|nr:AAA family ATPase [uncultured Lamprocystis sp.]
MLNRIRIKGYKSLRDVEVRLQPLSVLLGPNAAGKSNFLDALQLLSKIVSCRTLKDAFEPPYRGKPLESFSFGADGLKGLLAQDSLSFAIEVDFTLSDAVVETVNRGVRELKSAIDPKAEPSDDEPAPSVIQERNLRYRIAIEMLPRSGILRVSDEYLAALDQNGEPSGTCEPYLFRHDDRLQLRLEGQESPSYRELYLDHSILSFPNYPAHHPHMVAARMELGSWLFFYFEPRERMRAANPVKEVRHIGLMGEELPAYLNTLRALEPRQFAAVEKALKTILPQIDGIDVGVSDLGEVELRLRENGILVPARVLSEGTLRILGMLALTGAREPPALIGFEEPENGIHPRRIQLIAELLKTRAAIGNTQYIVTTHSPILPDLMADTALYITRKTNAGTQIEPFSTWGPLARRGHIDDALMDRDDAGLSVSERLLRGDFDD